MNPRAQRAGSVQGWLFWISAVHCETSSVFAQCLVSSTSWGKLSVVQQCCVNLLVFSVGCIGFCYNKNIDSSCFKGTCFYRHRTCCQQFFNWISVLMETADKSYLWINLNWKQLKWAYSEADNISVASFPFSLRGLLVSSVITDHSLVDIISLNSSDWSHVRLTAKQPFMSHVPVEKPFQWSLFLFFQEHR